MEIVAVAYRVHPKQVYIPLIDGSHVQLAFTRQLTLAWR